MEALRNRLMDILRRFVRADDADLSDDEFIHAVLARYEETRASYLIDPSE